GPDSHHTRWCTHRGVGGCGAVAVETAGMSETLVVMLALAGGTYVFKAAGPVVLGGRERLPVWLERLALLLPAPLLAALVATSTLVDDRQLVIDTRLAGLAAAALALWWRANFIVVVVAAAGTTAVVRLLT
ncbi:MAG: AzlD domain-containing protein, partial [Acidimicrobiales bacterium]